MVPPRPYAGRAVLFGAEVLLLLRSTDVWKNRRTLSTMATSERGTVRWFSNQKGYGFIARESGEDVFVHFSSISGDGYKTLTEGEQVEFSVEQGAKGLAAVDVHRVQDGSTVEA
jgi:CspA family cold shock protein